MKSRIANRKSPERNLNRLRENNDNLKSTSSFDPIGKSILARKVNCAMDSIISAEQAKLKGIAIYRVPPHDLIPEKVTLVDFTTVEVRRNLAKENLKKKTA